MLELFLKLFAAVLVGGILGWEREKRQKTAGLRTYMLVSLGSAAFMVAGLHLQEDLGQTDLSAVRTDVQRILAGIIGGIGFLGAGSIIESHGGVYGITTAAGVWVAAAGGIACGCGYYDLAAIATILAWLVMVGVGRFEMWYFDKEEEKPPA